ncbi:hypothetical protein ACJMK2_042487 [Sinanodonta woodiana]|uniref:WAP domain-containing protein n=1 Tax=Sinanodonta woodiana TaxID=1069815 RepID=A0ABD3W7I3_SINWO
MKQSVAILLLVVCSYADDTPKMCKSGSPLPSIFCGRGPNHQDCPSGYYCNIDPLDRFAVCCAQEVKPGTCHKPPSIGSCVELCSSDEGCPGRKKCCSNGCGHSCQIPERLVTSPRTCPTPSDVGMCVEECSYDADCLSGQMCCSNGCGHTCQ